MLDRAWLRVLAAQEARDPGRAATIRALVSAAPAPLHHGVGAGFTAARLAWPHLDDTAHRAWLDAFLTIWRDTISNPALHRAFARALTGDAPHRPASRFAGLARRATCTGGPG